MWFCSEEIDEMIIQKTVSNPEC